MPDRDLKLNSLSRFSKQSPRLVLEEYGSCEVPAGCGGVVLRWRKPEAPIPMKLQGFAGNGMWDGNTLDGEDIRSRPKIPVSYGKHVLTFEIKKFKPEYSVLLLFCQLNEDYVRILKPEGDTSIITLPDGTWRYTFIKPASDWQSSEFDDSHWLSMIEKSVYSDPRYGGDVNQRSKRFYDMGATPIGIDHTTEEFADQIQSLSSANNDDTILYVRKTFSISENSGTNEEDEA